MKRRWQKKSKTKMGKEKRAKNGDGWKKHETIKKKRKGGEADRERWGGNFSSYRDEVNMG